MHWIPGWWYISSVCLNVCIPVIQMTHTHTCTCTRMQIHTNIHIPHAHRHPTCTGTCTRTHAHTFKFKVTTEPATARAALEQSSASSVAIKSSTLMSSSFRVACFGKCVNARTDSSAAVPATVSKELRCWLTASDLKCRWDGCVL